MSRLITSLVALTAAIAGVSASPLDFTGDLLPRATSSNFSLFAYGSASDTSIGGFPVFYYEGYAYIADPSVVNYTNNYVVFEQNSSDTTQWIANPLTLTNATWSDSLFYIPAVSGPMGFYKEGVSNVSESDIVTTGFKFYGSNAMVLIDGSFATDWYAVATGVDGLWSVGWNATGIDDAELLSLRKGKALNVEYPSRR